MKTNIISIFLLLILESCYLSNIRKVYETKEHTTALSYYIALKNNCRFKPYRKVIKELLESFKLSNIGPSFETQENLNKIFNFLNLNFKKLEIIEKGLRNMEAYSSEKHFLSLLNDAYLGNISFKSKEGLSINRNDLYSEYEKFNKVY